MSLDKLTKDEHKSVSVAKFPTPNGFRSKVEKVSDFQVLGDLSLGVVYTSLGFVAEEFFFLAGGVYLISGAISAYRNYKKNKLI